MSHARTQIRDRFISTIGALSTLSGRVYASKTSRTNDEDLPIVVVYARSETSVADSFGADDPITRTLTVTVDIHATAPDYPDDVINDISMEIENAVTGDSYLAGETVLANLEGFEIIATPEARRPIGLGRIRYTVDYMTARSDPSVICT